MLRDRAAPGDAEHVCAVVAEFGEQLADEPAQASEAVRPGRQRRSADSGHVEADDFERRVKLVNERLEQLQTGADAVDQQQRRLRRLAPEPAAPGRTAIRIS